MTLSQWLHYHQQVVLGNAQARWMGVLAAKNPLDAWIYQEILFELRPDTVVEIGGYHGGSTLYLAHLMDIMGGGRVVSVDIDRTHWEVEHARISLVTGDSSRPETVDRVREIAGRGSVMVIQDGDHSRDGVLRDLHAYADLVTHGQYLVVEDGIMDVLRPGGGLGSIEPGAMAAVERFLQEDRRFAVDDARERYILTYNPKGFLKRLGP